MPKKRMLSVMQELAVIERYERGELKAKIALDFSCSKKVVQNTIVRYGIARRVGGRRVEYEPTPKEIEEGTAKIRDGWSNATRQRRSGEGKPVPYTIPTGVETFVTASHDPDLHGILTGQDSWGLL